MSEHYHDAADLKLMKEMRKLAPADFDAWLGLDKIVGRDGAIPRKYRELMAIAVACTTQCPYCIEAHAKGAKAAVSEHYLPWETKKLCWQNRAA